MKGYTILAALLVCGVVYAAQDTALTNREVRDPLQLEAWLEANASDAETRVAALEAGTLSAGAAIVGNASVKGSFTLISTNGATTNVVGTVNGTVDGEYIADDTIDDDSIDFSDVTGADLTLTDCSAVTASGAVYGGTVGFSAATGYFSVINTTQLVFIANSGAATNVLDADITTP